MTRTNDKALGCAILAGALMALAARAEALTLHVSPSGSDENAGTEAAPLQTVAAALAKAGVTEVVLAPGTYPQTSKIALTSAVTVRGATGDPLDVTLDFQKKSPGLELDHADAVVRDLRVFQATGPDTGAGVRIGAAGGTLRNCRVESCHVKWFNTHGPVALESDRALVSGCEIRACGVAGLNGDVRDIGVYVANGATLERTLVAGCCETTTYADGKSRPFAVRLEKGRVRNCTIVGNVVSDCALSCADSEDCEITDTIAFGNVSLRGTEPNGPDVCAIGQSCVVKGLFTENPMFVDAAGGDYSLAPGSPCIGAGENGGDLGYRPYDPSRAALGIRVSVRTGTAPLEAKVELTSANVDMAGATIAWEGLDETGVSFSRAFGGGRHALKATVTLADATVLVVRDPNALSVTYPAGVYAVETSEELDRMLTGPLSDGVVIRLADRTTYTLPGNCYKLVGDVSVVGGSREGTVLKKASGGRFFYLNHSRAAVASLTMTDGEAGCSAGGVWIDGRGGILSNCVVTACKTGASQPGGGVWMNSVAAHVTHCRIAGNTVGQNSACGGVRLSYGLLSDSLIVGNQGRYNDRTQVIGSGVYMDTATPDAAVVNCTIAGNVGYKGSGLYRVANGGYVRNTLVFGNSAHTGEKDVFSVEGTTRPNAAAISHCCTSQAVGSDCQVVSAAPYDEETYELTAERSVACIDTGDSGQVVSTTDYAGAARIFGRAVDIGCFEYGKAEIVASFTSDRTEAAGRSTFTFTARLSGVTDDAWTCRWYLDGASEPSGEGRVWRPELDVGRHAVRLVVRHDGTDYAVDGQEAAVVYPTDAHVGFGTRAAWPYDTPETAATNLNEAVRDVLRAGVTLHLAAGTHWVTNTVSVGANCRIVGLGPDGTVIACPDPASARRVLCLNGTDAWVEGVCVSNGLGQGGGVLITGDGGTFVRGRIVCNRGTTNLPGGGALVESPNGRIARTVIANNRTEAVSGAPDTSGVNFSGGGASIKSGIIENCLIVGNKAKTGGGLKVFGGVVRNCTIVGNTTGAESDGNGGGVQLEGGRLENCIVWGNADSYTAVGSLAQNVGGVESLAHNCCTPVSFGNACVTDDPQFKDAETGDYRIDFGSPCRKKGVYGDWMADAVDFFGSPRADARHRVDIGFCQASPNGLLLLVR